VCWSFYLKIEPYGPEKYIPMFFGLILCFFGGSYLTLIAAIEAVRQTVWARMKDDVIVLYDNYKKAKAASDKDDGVDANNDGVPDVKQISKKDLLTRKVYLVLRTADPDKTTQAMSHLWVAWLSVVATLRVKFAQSVTLGCSIGEMMHKHLEKAVEPSIKTVLPPELQKWSPAFTQYMFKFLGVLFAWFLQRVISGFHSAIRGGHLFATNAVKLAKEHGFVDANFDEKSPKVSGLATLLAIIGFYWQLSNGFSLPFPLNMLLLPVTIVEWMVEIFVGVTP